MEVSNELKSNPDAIPEEKNVEASFTIWVGSIMRLRLLLLLLIVDADVDTDVNAVAAEDAT